MYLNLDTVPELAFEFKQSKSPTEVSVRLDFGCLIEFEAINEEILPLLIEQAEDSQNENEVIYKVKSFTTDDIIYNVSVIEDKMKAYNCPDFTWNNIACEHMYLLKRYNRNIISTDLPTPEVFIDNTRTEQQQPIEIELQAFPQTIVNG
ncbi:hypothetical protein BDF21DRAFT_404537 [Thamnidium elegans]|nr:hypothetical protein BDF21DRAFT_404537 [Thamnidium elegans]